MNRTKKIAIAALVLLLLELCILFLPILSGNTISVYLRYCWQYGFGFRRVLAFVALVIFPVGSVILLLLLLTGTSGKAENITASQSEPETVPSASRSAHYGNLVFLSGSRAGESIKLPAYKTMELGRSSQSCQITVPETDISRKHVSLCYHGDRKTFLITDHSANGTYWSDGRRLAANTSVEVPNGSTFYLGNKKTAIQLLAETEESQ